MSRSNRTLVLITNNYPFKADGGEVTFVHPEVAYIKKFFDRVIIAPCDPAGPNLYPSNDFELDLTLGKKLKTKKLVLALSFLLDLILGRAGFFLKEIIAGLRRWGGQGGLRAIWWAIKASAARKWFHESFRGDQPLVIYTYWNTAVTVGIAYAAKEVKSCAVATRVHGHDLYAERHNPSYIPFRSAIYSMLARIFPVAQAGVDYLLRAGVQINQLRLARLGIEDPGFLCNPSRDEVFRLTSCSFLAPVKRVPFLAECICAFARSRPLAAIEWTHIGDGVDRPQVEKVLKNLPNNLKVRLLGHVKNTEVLQFYKEQPSDIFIHLSSSEGLPVSMMEASAVGLPILATNVGGVSEIVTANNGFLLSHAPTVTEVINAIAQIVDLDTEKIKILREGARSVWESYSARKNYQYFGEQLLSLLT